MPRVARTRLSRRSRNSNNLHYFRQSETSQERSIRLENQRVRYSENRTRINIFCNRSAFNYRPELDYLNNTFIQIGPMNTVCIHCHAKKWKDETDGICCANGKVILPDFEDIPDLIKSLIINAHPDTTHFLKNSRGYNTIFQMTSFGAKEVSEGNYMPTFKIQGQVYHLVGSLFPEDQNNAKFLQIYFMSQSDQEQVRSNMIPNLRPGLIRSIQTILHEKNRLIRSFKYNVESTSENGLNNLRLIIHADRVPQGQHAGRYNAPTTDEVAVLLVDEDKGPRDIVLHSRNGQLHRVSELHPSYDALQYPLMFINGEDGYHINVHSNTRQTNSNQLKTVSCMQFYSYRFMIRENCLNHLHYYKNLFNQYAVDMMAKMISERLNFIRNNQTKLRAECYIHLQDAINNDANIESNNIGQQVILPSSFTASPRYMHEKTQDAMTYVRKFGRPDLFITFTCNPEWTEIKNELFPGQKSQDRHDIISRVFKLKLNKLMDVIKKKLIFGEVHAHIYSVEWQKRGLPHCHILLWLQTRIQPDEVDKIISAEIPDKQEDPLLYDIICKNMIHGPCGELNINSSCMNNGICLKKYPRKLIKETQTGDDGYPTYRRRAPKDGGNTANLKIRGQEMMIDNRWVVPYCHVLSRMFSAHINVEYCHSVKSIKYVCKYINKGSDRATFSVNQDNDEVSNYLNGRYICTSEAFWRFFNFSIHDRFPTVKHLDVHLENNQRVYFTDQNLHEIIQNPKKTTLIAFFELCSKDEFAKTLLYADVPSYYTWDDKQGWLRRKRGEDVPEWPGVKKDQAIGRVYTIHPNQIECFHLRILLHHVRGPTSWLELKTVNNILHPTFKAACFAHGLLENDDQWKNTLEDAAISESPTKLRDLFAVILVFCQPSDPMTLWMKFRNFLCEDILHRERNRVNNFEIDFSDEIYNRGLIEIEDKVVSLSEKYLTEFGLASPIRDRSNQDAFEFSVIGSYDQDQLNEFVQTNLPKLVHDQRIAFDNIIESIINNQGKVFFLDAPGGTGKTFLINLLLAKIRSLGKTALAVASSGITATLLSGGRTAHSTFKLPLNTQFQREFVCPIRKNGPLGKILQQTSFVVWDECTMSHRAHIEAIDRSLRDIRSNNNLMGGITFVFAGDFRQTLPVIPKGTRADIINACLKSSPIWNRVQTLNLRTNMRAHLSGGNTIFSEKLLKIGNGTLENDSGLITVDQTIGKLVHTVDELIYEVYPGISDLSNKSYQWLCDRAIVSPRNVTVDEINNKILQKFEAESNEYLSIDTVTTEDAVNYPIEFLNSLTPPGFPPHKLVLKIGAPITLLRNIQPPNLCNGTRLQIKTLRNNVIEAIILTGPAAGEMAFIPRIPMIPTDLPFQFKRLQFPVKLSFAITINKGQGQTFKYVGIDLRQDCFSHGQLYVGLSRVGNPNNQIILIPTGNITKNVIYSEVL